MCVRFADVLVGENAEGGLARAWVEVYRGLEHNSCISQCKELGKRDFPQPAKVLAGDMQQLHAARISADYDPTYVIDLISLNSLYAMAEKNIAMLKGCTERDLKALASWMLFKSLGAKRARESAGLLKPA